MKIMKESRRPRSDRKFTEAEIAVLMERVEGALSTAPSTFEAIAAKAGIADVDEVAYIMFLLEFNGNAKQLPGKLFIKM